MSKTWCTSCYVNRHTQQGQRNVKQQSERARKGLNATSDTEFAALPLVKSVSRSARAVVSVVTLSLLNLPA